MSESADNINPAQELVSLNMADVAKCNQAPHTDWTEMRDTDHFVQFYEADGFLLNSLSGFIGKAIESGHGDSLQVRVWQCVGRVRFRS